MKKFSVSMIILILLGGAAFYFGWVKASVPAGEYGVVISKTHGVDPEIIRDGKFRWLWYKLIPTNTKVFTFKLSPTEKTFSVNGSLPSENTYALFSGVEMDFSYELDGSFSFLLKPETLPALAENFSVSEQASLEKYLDSLAERISAFTIQQIQRYSEESSSLENIRGNLLPQNLVEEIQSAFPEISNFTCTITNAHFPDFDLYESAKALFQNYLARQGEVLMEQAAGEAAKKNAAEERYNELKRYGELLNEYPLLIQYMAIEKGMEEVIKTLPAVVLPSTNGNGEN